MGESKHTPAGRYFHEPAKRGSRCVIRYMAPHYTGAGEVVARGVELELARRIAALLNGDAAAPELLEALRTARQQVVTLGGDVVEIEGKIVSDAIQAAVLSVIDAALAKAEAR